MKAKYQIAEAFNAESGQMEVLLISAKSGRVQARQCYGCGGAGCQQCDGSGWL